MSFRIVILACFLGLSGCDLPFVPEPGASASPATSPSAQASPTPTKADALAAKRRANAELLSEMMLVVFMRQPKDVAEFSSYLNVIQQGATFEGLYNGFTHSSDYREVEKSNRGATPIALKT